MKTKAKLKCTHCGKNHTYFLGYYQFEVTCKFCKKEQDIKFTDNTFKIGLLY